MTVVQGYAYDNQSTQAGEQHEALAAMLDGQTRRRIEGLLDLPGKRACRWRRRALRNMIGALEPDGAVGRYQKLHLQILASHGNDRNWSRGALPAFQDEGLQDVQVTVHGSSWRGGDPGCRLLRAGMGQLREEVLALGMTGEDLDQAAEALMDPRLIIDGYPVYLTSGRKPV